jgi:hypothetical protein
MGTCELKYYNDLQRHNCKDFSNKDIYNKLFKYENENTTTNYLKLFACYDTKNFNLNEYTKCMKTWFDNDEKYKYSKISIIICPTNNVKKNDQEDELRQLVQQIKTIHQDKYILPCSKNFIYTRYVGQRVTDGGGVTRNLFVSSFNILLEKYFRFVGDSQLYQMKYIDFTKLDQTKKNEIVDELRTFGLLLAYHFVEGITLSGRIPTSLLHYCLEYKKLKYVIGDQFKSISESSNSFKFLKKQCIAWQLLDTNTYDIYIDQAFDSKNKIKKEFKDVFGEKINEDNYLDKLTSFDPDNSMYLPFNLYSHIGRGFYYSWLTNYINDQEDDRCKVKTLTAKDMSETLFEEVTYERLKEIYLEEVGSNRYDQKYNEFVDIVLDVKNFDSNLDSLLEFHKQLIKCWAVSFTRYDPNNRLRLYLFQGDVTAIPTVSTCAKMLKIYIDINKSSNKQNYIPRLKVLLEHCFAKMEKDGEGVDVGGKGISRSINTMYTLQFNHLKSFETMVYISHKQDVITITPSCYQIIYDVLIKPCKFKTTKESQNILKIEPITDNIVLTYDERQILNRKTEIFTNNDLFYLLDKCKRSLITKGGNRKPNKKYPKKSSEKVKIKGKLQSVYIGSRGGRYIKTNKRFVSIHLGIIL